MNKRQFLKTSGALITGSVLSRVGIGALPDAAQTNWAGNYRYRARRVDTPATTAEVQRLVKESGGPLKALGSRHSFNGIADSTGDQISLQRFDQMVVDEKARTVTVGAGVRYGQLAPYLDGRGYALHNLASLPHISVAGACATATHGSGWRNGNLATAVSGVEIVNADGETVTLTRDRDGERFRGVVVGLGGLGVVTQVTLDIQPTYKVSQVVYQGLALGQLKDHLEEIFSSGYSVSLFTDWQNGRISEVWIKSRLDGNGATPPSAKREFFGAKAATRNLHPIEGLSAVNCTEQMGIPGPWYERLPHFRMNFTPSAGKELQSEYFVPRERAYEAIRAVEKLRDHITPHLLISELRTIAADELWMSPCYQRASLTIHFTWKPEWAAVKGVLPLIEEQLAPFEARPHWAKLFTMAPSRLDSLYPKLADYRTLVKQFDGSGKFRNEFLNTNLFGG